MTLILTYIIWRKKCIQSILFHSPPQVFPSISSMIISFKSYSPKTNVNIFFPFGKVAKTLVPPHKFSYRQTWSSYSRIIELVPIFRNSKWVQQTRSYPADSIYLNWFSNRMKNRRRRMRVAYIVAFNQFVNAKWQKILNFEDILITKNENRQRKINFWFISVLFCFFLFVCLLVFPFVQ